MTNDIRAIRAVCALIPHPYDENLFLSISRKNDANDFGLPGGKKEQYENDKEALYREVLEEIGIDLKRRKSEIIPLLDGEDESGAYVTTYLVYVNDHPDDLLKVRNQKNEGVVKWVAKEVLCSGSFSVYNTKLFDIFLNFFKPVQKIHWVSK